MKQSPEIKMYFSAYNWENTKLFAVGNGSDFFPQFKGSDNSALDL